MLSPTAPPSLSARFLSVESLPRETAEATGACVAELGIKQGAGVNPIPPLTHWASLSNCVTSDPQCSHLGNRDKNVYLTENFVGWKNTQVLCKMPRGEYVLWKKRPPGITAPGVTPSLVHPLLCCGALGKSITPSESLSSSVR